MQFYPINLNLHNRRCAVIGGGSIAYRKVKGLCDAGAVVTVISPTVVPSLEEYAKYQRIQHISRTYRQGDLEDFFIVICATNNYEVNEAAAEEAKRNGALVNIVDNPDNCDFTIPAKIVRDDLVVTVATNGLSPAYAKYIKAEIDNFIGPEYGIMLKMVAGLRRKLKESIPEAALRECFWQQEIQEIVLLIKQGKLKEAEEKIDNAVSGIGSQS